MLIRVDLKNKRGIGSKVNAGFVREAITAVCPRKTKSLPPDLSSFLRLQIGCGLDRKDVDLDLFPKFRDIARRFGRHFLASGAANERGRTLNGGGVFLQIDQLMRQSLGHAYRVVFYRNQMPSAA